MCDCFLKACMKVYPGHLLVLLSGLHYNKVPLVVQPLMQVVVINLFKTQTGWQYGPGESLDASIIEKKKNTLSVNQTDLTSWKHIYHNCCNLLSLRHGIIRKEIRFGGSGGIFHLTEKFLYLTTTSSKCEYFLAAKHKVTLRTAQFNDGNKP